MIEVATEQEMKEALYCDQLCKKLGHAVVKAYPNRRWFIEVLDKGKIAVVKMPQISMEFGNMVKLEGSITVDEKTVTIAAGELLERFKLTREKGDNTDVMLLARNHKGVIGAEKGEI